MTPEKQRLIDDLLQDEQNSRRETVLLAGGQILRRKRRRRNTIRGLSGLALLCILALSVEKTPTPRPSPSPQTVTESEQARSLSDEELLALFPDSPVALATLDSGKKILIFPRAGDKQRFVNHL
jgi:hypothetical protein